jgi:uncharacterized protein (DUF2141 family)
MGRYLLITSIVVGLAMVGAAAYGDDTGDEETGTIIVTAVGFNSDKGQAVIGVYERGKNWLKLGKAFRTETVPIKNGKISITLKGVPHDEYGITVLHDKNSNGKMDMRWVPYPKPKEGGGVSNNWVRSGKPEYSKAKFDLDRSFMSVRIKMVY